MIRQEHRRSIIKATSSFDRPISTGKNDISRIARVHSTIGMLIKLPANTDFLSLIIDNDLLTYLREVQLGNIRSLQHSSLRDSRNTLSKLTRTSPLSEDILERQNIH